MATIAVHEFISLDGVFESPTWTFEYGFDPKMGETLGAITGAANTILLGRTTYEMFAPAWRDRTAEDDPGAPFFNETEKLVVGTQELEEEWNNSTPHRRLRRRRDPQAQGRAGRRHLHLRQRPAGPGAAQGRPGRRPAPVRLPDRPRRGRAVLEGRRRPDQARAQGHRRLRQRRRPPGLRPGLVTAAWPGSSYIEGDPGRLVLTCRAEVAVTETVGAPARMSRDRRCASSRSLVYVAALATYIAPHRYAQAVLLAIPGSGCSPSRGTCASRSASISRSSATGACRSRC